MPDVAPAGTVIRCRVCDARIAVLTADIERGGVLRADAVELVNGQVAAPGLAVVCPVNAEHEGAVALVNDETWRTWR